MKATVINIVTDAEGKTIGATIRNQDESIVNLKTSELTKLAGLDCFDNAIVDKNGYIRAKSGNLHKICCQPVSRKNTHNNECDNEYIVMMKNKAVCKISRNSGDTIIYDDKLMPYDLYLDRGSHADKQNNIVTFNWWCAHRILSLDREHAKVILNACGIRQATTDIDRADIALKYKCLSLKDFYWVKNESDTSKWENINLFDNSLSNAVVNLALNGEKLSVTSKHLIDSDLATDGLFPKAWYRKDNIFYLYKGDKDGSVNKEVSASKILLKLGFSVLRYEKAVYDNSVVAISRCFTSNDIGYVTAGDMIQNYNIITDCYEYDIMNLCDYLVGNSDRHQDNWGYMFNDNREIIGFAPIFDFNHAFEAPENYRCLPEQLLGRDVRMIEAAQEVVSRHNIELSVLPEIDEYTNFVNNRIRLINKYKI